ncbi:Plant peroxidase [Macleaya cordata]|uniref:Peroxidase n=1 Tax=Macleaya cordata TaxID=56857 RepID=A0A200RAZ0_MACCD|nr:Plant peroxidase [Macleaya cordata]
MKVGALTISSTVVLFFFCTLLQPTVATSNRLDGNHLHRGFYNNICPQAENIVSKIVKKYVRRDLGIAAGLIRLHFHDCFVTGCDASILLDETPSGEEVEKASPANGKSLRGLEVIDEIKSKLEYKCPGIVSCADILAFAARDAAVYAGLLSYPVAAGRRDGRSSRAIETMILPRPSQSVDQLTELFARKGLSQDEMVVLSGAHSIGHAHCSTFHTRLYGPDPLQSQDPTLDPFYALFLKFQCPVWTIPEDGSLSKDKVPLDSISPTRLDNMYYVGLKEGKGLLTSDQALMNNTRTRDLVHLLAENPMLWSQKFGRAMGRLGRMDVLTGRQGEIRRQCRRVN